MNPELGHEPVGVDLYVTNDNPWTEEDFEKLRYLRMKVGDVVDTKDGSAVVSKVFFWGYESLNKVKPKTIKQSDGK